MPKTQFHPCPKCNRQLQSSGAVVVDGLECPIYSCDECIVQVDFGGEKFDQALTFAVGKDGQPFDPADPDEKLRY